MSYFKTFCTTLLNADKFLVLDTETTGLNDGEICQIAVIRSDGIVVYDTFVRTHDPIPAEATAIHKITDELVLEAPTFPVVAEVLKTLLFGQVVVTYNAVYDRKMLHQSAEIWDMPKIDWKSLATFHCAMEAYAEYYGQWNNYHKSYTWQKLSVAAKSEDLLVENAHSALGDCVMTLGVIGAMLRWWTDSANSDATIGE